MPLHGDDIVVALREGTVTSQDGEARPIKRRRLSNNWRKDTESFSTRGNESSTASGRTSDFASKSRIDVIDLTGDVLDAPTEQLEATPPADTVAGQTHPHVQLYRPSLPDSSFSGSRMSEISLPEMEVTKRLCASLPQNDEQDYSYFELTDFTVYKPESGRRALDMVTLDKLQVKSGGSANECFCFDGTLSAGDKSFAVHNVPFSILAVDGYGDTECSNMEGKISIQTPIAAAAAGSKDLWYRLGKPSDEYRRFFEPFTWLAVFTKFFVEFLLEEEDVALSHFRANFFDWLQARYAGDTAFQKWHDQCGLSDFRTTVAARVGYLYKEAYSVDGEASGLLLQHPVWREVHFDSLDAIKEQKNVQQDTVITPFVYDMFAKMYFSKKLKQVAPSAKVEKEMASRKRQLCLTPLGALPTDKPQSALHFADPGEDWESSIGTGTVVFMQPDRTYNSKWRRSSSRYWYAYVQDVRVTKAGTVLDVLYLYEPCDTTLGAAYYPFQNELFLSDNCACGKDAVPLEDIEGIANVDWFKSDPASSAVSAYFVRRKFRTNQEHDTNNFARLRETDFSCKCNAATTSWIDCVDTYQLDDTVLVRQPDPDTDREETLVPARVVEFVRKTRKVRVLQLSRAKHQEANEVAESLRLLTVAPDRVVRKCSVGHFQSRSKVTVPYNRGGSGDYFFLISDRRPKWLKQQTWTTQDERNKPPLVGLGLFCGGGNFDRGLEEGGAVKFKYAVDWAKHALHSYRANVKDPQYTQYFLGSVNDYLFKALKGSPDVEIAKINSVSFISAGSPCPGFSRMQGNFESDASLRNASMVASVVAHVDLYSPKYLVFENVVSMTQGLGAKKNENVFAQVLAALVALGYQVQQFLIDSWCHGSCQQRTRVFIIACAPEVQPFEHPPQSHEHPPGIYNATLGKATNGLPFGVRRDHVCAFDHISPQEATADLPDIGDSMPQLCIPFPDHRTITQESLKSRERIARISLYPHGMGLAQTLEQATKTEENASGEAFEYLKACSDIRNNHKSSSYARIYRNGLFPTMMTAMHVACGKSGRSLHWLQPRTYTVLEARRAQGFLDHEVIIGTPMQQMKIIGNSVDRHAAFALGLALRESWLARWEDEQSDDGQAEDMTVSVEDHVEDERSDGRAEDMTVAVEDYMEAKPRPESNLKHQLNQRVVNMEARLDHIRQKLEVERAEKAWLWKDLERQEGVIRQLEDYYSISSSRRGTSQPTQDEAARTAQPSSRDVIVIDDSSSDEASTPHDEGAAKGGNGLLTPAKEL